MLTAEQRERYSRQLVLPEIGEAGQERLLAGRVLVVGVGGLGSPASIYLAAAGVGRIGLVDPDRVDLSNLQRQIMHTVADLGREKVRSGKEALAAINPDVRVTVYPLSLSRDNAREIVRAYDFVIDATDNFAAKFLIPEVCHVESIPYCHGAILRSSGQAMTVLPGRTACYPRKSSSSTLRVPELFLFCRPPPPTA